MIEVLIAMVVLSVGLLGNAALLVAGMRYADSAYERSQAAMSAYAILDRIRANRDEWATGAYNTQGPSSLADLTAPSSGTGGAEHDVYDWLRELDGTLPNATGEIDCSTAGVCTIRVAWNDWRADCSSAAVTDCGASLKEQVLAAQI